MKWPKVMPRRNHNRIYVHAHWLKSSKSLCGQHHVSELLQRGSVGVSVSVCVRGAWDGIGAAFLEGSKGGLSLDWV